RHALALSGQAGEMVSSAQVESDEWFAVLRVPREGGNAEGPLLPQDAVEISLRRRVGPAMREEITVRNQSGESLTSRLEIALDADFVDIAHDLDPDLSRILNIDRTWEPDG